MKAGQLQFLRFIAFCFIFLYHAFGTHLAPFFYADSAGTCMISFFFLLSGFGTGYASADACVRPDLKAVVRREFEKIRRFYPLFLATTLFALLLTSFPEALNQGETGEILTDLGLLARTLLLLQSWRYPFLYFNGVTWFLSTLIFLNLLDLPVRYFLDLLHEKKEERQLLTAGILFFLLMVFLMSFVFSGRSDLFYSIYAFPPSRIFQYLLGVFTGRLILRNREEKQQGTPSLYSPVEWTGLEALALLLWIGCGFLEPQADYLQVQIIGTLPSLLLLAVFGSGEGYFSRLFCLPFFTGLGGITMECYLIHQLLILTYQRFVTMENTFRGTVFYAVFTFGMTLFFSLLLHRKGEAGKTAKPGKVRKGPLLSKKISAWIRRIRRSGRSHEPRRTLSK